MSKLIKTPFLCKVCLKDKTGKRYRYYGNKICQICWGKLVYKSHKAKAGSKKLPHKVWTSRVKKALWHAEARRLKQAREQQQEQLERLQFDRLVG